MKAEGSEWNWADSGAVALPSATPICLWRCYLQHTTSGQVYTAMPCDHVTSNQLRLGPSGPATPDLA
eukprot:7828540-Alexandrium_andersonii.AAC.1